MPKLRRALARGRRADHWFVAGTTLVLRHPGGHEREEIPVAHVRDDATMLGHYARLESKRWVSLAAIDELRDIVAGANR